MDKSMRFGLIGDDQCTCLKYPITIRDYWIKLKEHYEKSSLRTRIPIIKTIFMLDGLDD